MATTINISDAKAHLSELVDRALEGEEVVITRRNRPVVRLTVVERRDKAVRLGRYAGQGWIADDFDEPLHDFDEYM